MAIRSCKPHTNWVSKCLQFFYMKIIEEGSFHVSSTRSAINFQASTLNIMSFRFWRPQRS